MKRRTPLHLFLILVIAASALARQQPLSSSAPSVERLREIVSYLASDKLEGRRTGTRGAKEAAQYIAGEFARYGLKPGGSPHLLAPRPGITRYMQAFPFVAGVELGKSNTMLFTPRASSAATQGVRAASLDLRLQEDWMPLGFSANARVENAPVMFVGYGITAADLKYDDYAGADVTGRIALAFAGTPDRDNPHGPFARYEGLRWKAIAAREHGARALVVVSSEENFKDDRLSRLRYDNSAGDAGLPVVVISRQAAAQMFGLNGLVPLAEVEKLWRDLSSAKGTATADNYAAKVAAATEPLKAVALTISTDVVRQNVEAANVVAILEGSDAKLKNEAIVIGAHYDHLGRGGEGSLAAREGEIHHGADDNASGVAGLLELARIFSAEGPKPKRTIVFIAFSGEEEGLIGSNFYVNHPVVPINQTVAMINMDMIGRMKENRLIIGGVGTAEVWREWITAANVAGGMKVSAGVSGSDTAPQRAGVSAPLVVGANGQTVVSLERGGGFNLTLNEDGYGPSDHSSFYAKQVPVLFFWTGTHDDYHKPSDTADKINYEEEARILSFIAEIVRKVDASEKRPTYTVAKSESTGRTTGFRVYLGTIPNYADSNDGLKLDGVRDDSPASKAGLKAGDVIVKLAGRDVRNVYDYTYVLGEMKAGEEYEVEVMRAGQRLKLKIIPASRK
jgi:aminopeptidase YwaD